MPTFATYTLGCKANQAETAQIENILKNLGYRKVNFKDPADNYIINTCTVTHIADRKSRNFIRQPLKNNPTARLVVTGCFTENNISFLKEVGASIVTHSEKLDASSWEALFPVQTARETSSNKTIPNVRHMVKLQDGCNVFCSYCIVPHVRSKLHSTPLKEIIAQALECTSLGAKELVLTGINIGLYKDKDQTLIDVLKQLADIPELVRIRISSIELPHVTRELIELIARNAKLCHHLHIPLQSGSDSILQAMGRPYTTEEFLRTAQLAKELMPDIALTTDVIVGFPGETEDDFNKTVQFIKKVGFSLLHVFKYSARPGTKAAALAQQVETSIVSSRSDQLIALGKLLEKEFATKLLNRPINVLFENVSANKAYGFTSNYVKIYAQGNHTLGEYCTITPTKLDTDNTLSA